MAVFDAVVMDAPVWLCSGAALVAYKLYSRLAEWANDWCEFELNTKLQGVAA